MSITDCMQETCNSERGLCGKGYYLEKITIQARVRFIFNLGVYVFFVKDLWVGRHPVEGENRLGFVGRLWEVLDRLCCDETKCAGGLESDEEDKAHWPTYIVASGASIYRLTSELRVRCPDKHVQIVRIAEWLFCGLKRYLNVLCMFWDCTDRL